MDFVQWARKKTDRVDVLLNNAGGALGLDPVAEGRDADWETMLQTNVLGVLRMTRAVLPQIPRDAGASIINIGSYAGHGVYEGGAAYCAAKAGELQITRVLRLELNGTGIRVSTVDPGLAKTDFSLVRFKGDAVRAEKIYEGTHPLVAEDVAEIASVTNASLSWATSPTVPAQFFRRWSAPATIGAGILWTFPRGIMVGANASLVLWNIVASVANALWCVIEE